MNTAPRLVAALAAVSLAGFTAAVQAAPILTSAATTAGFTLSSFLDQVPQGGIGPIGIVNTTSGILVSNYADGALRAFTDVDGHHWSDSSTLPGATYGGSNGTGLAQLDGKYYLAEQGAGSVVEVTANGVFIRTVVTGLPFATGIIANPFTHELYVSLPGIRIDVVNPALNSRALFNNSPSDGLALSADGTILYGADSGHILGFNTTTHLQVFDSGFVPGGADGTAFGSGALAGNVFVNTNSGTLIQINLTTLVQTVLVTAGSRGDFVNVDANNGTLLFTQTDSVWRLTAPSGACFGDSCNNSVPEPTTLGLLGLGLAGLGIGRRKRNA